MSNVIHFARPAQPGPVARLASHIACFGRHRRIEEDVFWLKENAELLNILECTRYSGAATAPEDLAPYQAFFDGIKARMGFFPQYYRFLLSICLDLEDLGLAGNRGEALCAWVDRAGLPEAELSDLQRAEARRLLARRDIDALPDDRGLTGRLHAFIDRSATFALPNKKAAYELTHIVFYLSEYGRRDPGLSRAAVDSLHFAGLVAWLEQNADLLAETCIALRYAGEAPPERWEAWLDRVQSTYRAGEPGTGDAYHAYFVGAWRQRMTGGRGFHLDLSSGAVW
ncbi:hypothetical protein AB9K41_05205, partial [Cribrihabitans sp. XS_ASV171]